MFFRKNFTDLLLKIYFLLIIVEHHYLFYAYYNFVLTVT